MTPADVELRNETYRLFVALGRAPTAEETGTSTGSTADEVREGWQRLHRDHALLSLVTVSRIGEWQPADLQF